jgi:hypothetical protein
LAEENELGKNTQTSKTSNPFDTNTTDRGSEFSSFDRDYIKNKYNPPLNASPNRYILEDRGNYYSTSQQSNSVISNLDSSYC